MGQLFSALHVLQHMAQDSMFSKACQSLCKVFIQMAKWPEG
jgi:hypothetical protein